MRAIIRRIVRKTGVERTYRHPSRSCPRVRFASGLERSSPARIAASTAMTTK